MNEDSLKEFITVGELKKMLESYSDNDLIMVTERNTSPNYKISHVEDSTCCGLLELRIIKN